MATYDKIERRILEYMLAGGQDSAEGIAQWWLLEQTIEDQTAKVKAALEHLVGEGLVAASKGLDSTTRYRIPPNRRQQIARLLDGTGGSPCRHA